MNEVASTLLEKVAAPVEAMVSLAAGVPPDVVQNTNSVGLFDDAVLLAYIPAPPVNTTVPPLFETDKDVEVAPNEIPDALG
jgi:hypothetical protein